MFNYGLLSTAGQLYSKVCPCNTNIHRFQYTPTSVQCTSYDTCLQVNINASSLKTIKFRISATTKGGFTKTADVSITVESCPTDTLTAPPQQFPMKLTVGSSMTFSFMPFTIKQTSYPECGFGKYDVTAKVKGTTTNVALINPHAHSRCASVNECLTRTVNDYTEQTITVTITASNMEPASVSTTLEI